MARSPLPADVTDLLDPDRYDRTTRRVLALVGAALLLRVAFLGARVAHFDEGRVAWWADYFRDTGTFHYRPIIHGPLVQHVNAIVFELIGTTDFAMRIFVALVGGFLPLSVLLYREHLREDELLAVGFFLAFNPILLYYSRFFRSTVPVAAFSFVAFGFFLRVYDEGSVRSLYAGLFFFALAFASKENAVVYVLCWVGALGLLAEHALFRTGDDQSGVDWLLGRVRAEDGPVSRFRTDPWYYLGHVVLAAGLFCVVTLYFYAPRTPNTSAIGFWEALGNPLKLPDLVSATYDGGATHEGIKGGYESWFGKSGEAGGRYDGLFDQYTAYFDVAFEALSNYAVPLSVLSVFGFFLERYGRAHPRNLVLFASYWGFVSVIGYPLGTDIANAWITVNAIVPLAIPAGVALAYVIREAQTAIGTDPVRFGIVAFALFLVVGQMGFAMATGVYTNPTGDDNELVQYAQPADDFRPAMRFVENRPDHEGTDVLFVGSPLARSSPRTGGMEPRCLNIGNALPLHWYVEAYDASADCFRDTETSIRDLDDYDPLVVVADERMRGQLTTEFPDYEVRTYRIRVYGSETVFLFDRDGTGGNESLSVSGERRPAVDGTRPAVAAPATP